MTDLPQSAVEIARGGMGTVELVVRRHGEFRRPYAIKRLHQHLAMEPRVRKMFVEEGRIAGLLHHPNVVPVLEASSDERGPYLQMEYVRGLTLHELLRRVGDRGDKMPVQVGLRIALDAARGLRYAHALKGPDGRELNLIHRDLSLGNLLVSESGVVRVTDFGIAKALNSNLQTTAGVLKGKYGYMAPEQLRFDPITQSSDLFSLGVVVFETFTLEALYGDEDLSRRAKRILEEPPPDLGEFRNDIPAELVDLLVRMLAKDPSGRPASTATVVHTFERLLARQIEDDGEVMEVGEWMETYTDGLRPALDALMRSAEEASASADEETPLMAGNEASRARSPAVARFVIGLILVSALAVFLYRSWAPEGATEAGGSGELSDAEATPAPDGEAPAMPAPTESEEEAQAQPAAPTSTMRRRRVPSMRSRRTMQPRPLTPAERRAKQLGIISAM